MEIVAATAKYERWLSELFELAADDLQLKHEKMANDCFSLLRATFYRWRTHWDQVPKAIGSAPQVLAVGDAHIENFGTWRDDEGRLVWGVNDFDEAEWIPYTSDLVRLAVSARLARSEGRLTLSADEIARAILHGYVDGLRRGGRAIVLDSGPWRLRDIVLRDDRNAEKFWHELLELPQWPGLIPRRARELLEQVPKAAHAERTVHRNSGLGSLGRPRWTALYVVAGGYIAREVKARAPSAWTWARREQQSAHDPLPRIWLDAVRSQDRSLQTTRRWTSRRRAPDHARIDLDKLHGRRDETTLLVAMGWELANVHLGSADARRDVLAHLDALDADWLPECSARIEAATRHDFAQWRESGSS